MFFTGPAAVRLYDDHVDAVHRYLTRRLGTDLATPLVGETFAHAVNSEGPPNNTSEMERSWLLSIATHLLRRHDDAERERLSTWGDRADDGEPETVDPLLGRTGADPEVGRVMHAAARLKPDDRDLLFLTVWEGYSQQTVARVLGLSTGATASALKRVRRELRKGTSAAEPDDADDAPGGQQTAPRDRSDEPSDDAARPGSHGP